MTLSKLKCRRFPVLIVALIISLTGCGSQATSRIKSDIAVTNEITVAIGPELNGKAMVNAAIPSSYTSIDFCVLDQNFNCVDQPTNMTFERMAPDRKIFSLPDSTILGTAIWKFTAADSNGSKIEQNIQIKPVDNNPLPSTGALNWKVLLMASDQGNQGAWINAFDNARKKLKQIFTSKGVPAANFRELSLHPDQQSQSVKPTSSENFLASMKEFGTPTANDACLIHMTSHGSPGGFNIGSDRLSPAELDQAIVSGCGDRPTVVLVSACFSGLYVLDKSNLKKPNRIILTAARSDLTSFGCSSEAEYTYWDSCLVESLPNATKWKALAADVVSCITRKESGGEQSFPQTFIGADIADLDLPR